MQTYVNLSVLHYKRISAGLDDTAPQLPRISNCNVAFMHSTLLSSSCTFNGHTTDLCTFFLSVDMFLKPGRNLGERCPAL